jgi:hypothetical protein
MTTSNQQETGAGKSSNWFGSSRKKQHALITNQACSKLNTQSELVKEL